MAEPDRDDPIETFGSRLRHLDEELRRAIESRGIAPSRSSLLAALDEASESAVLARLVESLGRFRETKPVDRFGYDPAFDEFSAPLFEFLYRRWWRVDVSGLGRVPTEGPVVFVANHSGGIVPWDALMVRTALALELPTQRRVRPLVERFAFGLPYLGTALRRIGCAPATPSNGTDLVSSGEAILGFPEGVRGLGKPFADRHRLEAFRSRPIKDFGQGSVPVVPVAIVGGEETEPLIGRWERPARLLGLPYLPITPTFPMFGLLGILPLPAPWTIHFGQPLEKPTLAGCRTRITEMLRDIRASGRGPL